MFWTPRIVEPPLSTLIHPTVRKALKKKSDKTSMGALARKVVQAQLEVYNSHESERVQTARKPASSLFDATLAKIADQLGDDPEEDLKLIEAIPEDVVRRAVWGWDKPPYSVVCAAQGRGGPSRSGAEQVQIDEWILRNERHLRESKPNHWSDGLVRLSTHGNAVFAASTVTGAARTITRSIASQEAGFTFLDQKRAAEIHLQASVPAFAKTFERMSNGLLRGLEWDNVCVAGGIALGSLLSPETDSRASTDTPPAETPNHWKNSDIDIYIHGLDPVHANAKLQHIFDVFKSNLPAGAPALVVRNSRTITFFSDYPLRRIQVVLKKVESPREVLLNFDLDICAVAWDGQEVWMLPRACRALETGYNVFTMNLINGHYLGARRASQEQRVFKYASKGYGIRILPEYVASLQESEKERDVLSTRANKLQPLEIVNIAENARAWTDKIVARYLQWNYRKQLHYLGGAGADPKVPKLRDEFQATPLPVFTHLLLDTRSQMTAEPGARSCLTGFELLMRHVRLWEKECAGELLIQDNIWASTTYADVYSTLTYDDAPKYEWNESFDMGAFKRALQDFNEKEESDFCDNYAPYLVELPPSLSIRRCAYTSTVSEILQPQCDIISGLWVPEAFLEYANDLVVTALADHGISSEPPLTVIDRSEDDGEGVDDAEKMVPVLWRISSLTMWQLLDRRIDEIYEVLWAFRRANENPETTLPERVKVFKIQILRRAIRREPGDEFKEFAKWVGRYPVNGASWYPGIGQGFWEDEDFIDRFSQSELNAVQDEESEDQDDED